MSFKGIVIGILLTIGLIYASDHGYAPTGFDRRPMVNWEVVGSNAQAVGALVRHGWNRLTAG